MKKLKHLLSDYAKVLESTPHYLSQYSISDILRTLDAIDSILEFTKESNEKTKNYNLDLEELNFFKIRLLARLKSLKTILENQEQKNNKPSNQLSLWE